jgi:hypothetical protein
MKKVVSLFLVFILLFSLTFGSTQSFAEDVVEKVSFEESLSTNDAEAIDNGFMEDNLITNGLESIEDTVTSIVYDEKSIDIGNTDSQMMDLMMFISPMAVDSTPPVTNATTIPSNIDDKWTSSDVTVTITASDDNNNLKIYYQVNRGDEIGTPFNGSKTGIVSLPKFTQSGEFIITYWAIDNKNNSSEKKDITIKIDKIGPTISLSQDPETETYGNVTVFADVKDTLSGVAVKKWAEGAKAATFFTAGGTALTDNTFNVSENGVYTVYAKDDAGNESVQTITISNIIIDTIAPVITLVGDAVVTIEVGNSYVDAGATARDNYDGDITGKIVTVNSVNSQVMGSYTVTYNVTDANNNKATEVTRIVNVVDTTAPVITLNGDAVVKIEVGSTYTDAGATANDNYDGDITGKIVTVNSVNCQVVGSYAVTYNVSDANGNAATEVTRTVNVVDTIAPVITLNGKSTITVEVHGSYKDEGAVVTDNYDSDRTIEGSGTIDFSKVGTYTLTYNATDAAGNVAAPVSRTINVVDTTAPVITLTGEEVVTIEVGSTYTDAGATASDNYDGDITDKIVTVNSVNNKVVGSYNVRYNVSDAAGNAAAAATRTVHVVDTTAPVITLNGKSTITVEVHGSYDDEGAVVTDNYDADRTIKGIGTIDFSKVGEYTLTYNATDAAGNAAVEVIRTVNVVDTTAPVITLNGKSTITVEVHGSYDDEGAVVTDNYDADRTIKGIGTIDFSKVGEYTLTYNATDAAGNAAVEVIRTVNVVDTTAPVITLNGKSTITVEVHGSYDDEGAVVTDNYDADRSIKGIGTIDFSKVGEYTLTYNVTDAAGNAAVEVIRTVNVVDTTAPVITLKGDAVVKIEVGSTYTDAGATANDNYDGDITGKIVTVNPVNKDVVGTYIVRYNVTDANGNKAAEVTRTVKVEYKFTGFFQPVENPGDKNVVNTVKAGSAVPIKFSLNGYKGLDIFESGYPKVIAAKFSTTAEKEEIDSISTVSNSGLTYDKATDQYTYVWKTDKSWVRLDKVLVIKLADGNEYKANFQFK